MVDSVQVFHPGWRFTDENGTPYSGAKLKFYNAGGLVARTVYSTSDLSTTSLGSTVYTDSAGAPVASQGSSTEVMVYTGNTAYKIVFTTSADVEIFTLDNIKGALDTSTFLTTGSTSTLTIPVISKTGDYDVVAADRSKVINADATGGTFTLTLTSAVTLGDNWSVFIRNTGTTNPVKIAASQAISGPWAGVGATTSFALRPGEGAFIVSNGATFVVPVMAPAYLAGTVGVIEITDRVSAAPGSPVAGARYIVSGAFSTFEQEDIIEADGAGSFFEITPPTDCGWLAYVQDEDAYYQFVASAWVELAATQALQETGTNVARFVTPGRQQYHQSAAKAWGLVTVSGAAPTLTAGYNIASITDGGAGIQSPQFTTAMSSANYAVVATITNASGASPGGVLTIVNSARLTTGFTLHIFQETADGDPDLVDNVSFSFVVYGDI